MENGHQHRLLRYLISPYGLATVSYVVFVTAMLFPPRLYSSVMDEPNFMFLDPASVLFFTLCTAFFVAGVWLVGVAFPVVAFIDRPLHPKMSPVMFLLLPLLPLLALNLLSNFLLIQNNPTLVDLLFSQGGNEIKEQLEVQGTFGLTSIYLLGIIWWVGWRSDQLQLRGRQRRIVKTMQYLATASVVISTTLKLGRGELMPVVTGIAVIYILRQLVRWEAGSALAFRTIAVFTVVIAAAFLLFSFIRGTSDTDKMASDIVGYTVCSYNHMAALLAGRLHYPYAGRGIYLFSFLGFNNVLNTLIPFRELLSWPSFYDAWQSEFSSTWRAGLNGYSIWVGAFGYIFADLGWWAPLFVFFQGVLCGSVWRAVKRGQIFGIVLYPWVAFCILFWMGTNYLLDNKFIVLLIDAVALTAYEWLFVVRATPTISSDGLAKL
jgi:hypothetical protein